jgi:hypothetical protein
MVKALAKTFDLFGIVLMAIAIGVGTMVGGMIAGYIGFGGGILGAFIVGIITYVIWAYIAGAHIDLKDGVIFSVLVYIAQIIAGYLQGMVGFGGALVAYLFTAVIFALLWGLIGGGKGKGGASKTSPIKV